MNVNSARSRITLKAIAEDLGVAPSTVSNAYNRPDQLSAELRARILERARQLGYAGPNPVAASLRRGKTGAIGVLYPNPLRHTFIDPVAASFMRGVASEAEKAGYGLLLIGGSFSETEKGVVTREVSLAATASVDGFVLYNLPGGDPLLDAVLNRSLPSVLVDSSAVAGVPLVTVEDEAGAYAAAEHLLNLGHKRLGVVSLELTLEAQIGLVDQERQQSATYRPTRDRLRGYAAAMRAAGLPWEKVLVYETVGNTPEQGEKAAAALLRQANSPTALLAMSDQLALGAIALARRRGIHIPDELSIVGYDDNYSASLSVPTLTTVRQPFVEKGRIAGEMLLARLGGEEPTSERLKVELVVRGSSGMFAAR